MNLLTLLKRQVPTLPTEVIQAACDLYGLSPQHIASIQAEQLSTLSPFLWVITLNDRQSAIVVSVPGERKRPVAAPWFGEKD